MSNINLLPWRQARAQRQKKQFGILFGLFLAGTAAIAFAADWLVQQQIGYQQQRNQRLQEMATLDTQLGEIRLLKERRKELIDRMQLIEQLQMRRNIPRRLFNQLPVLVPNGVYLDSLALQNNKIREGKDRSLWQGSQHDAPNRRFRLADTIPAQHHFHGRGGPHRPEPVLHDVPDCHGATQRG
jgi:Tfp pilus assembly protein PilN